MAAPHDVLGIPEDACLDQIRTAWRNLVRRTHPDRTGNDASSVERMKSINAAHDAMLEALVRAKSRQRGHRSGTTDARSARYPNGRDDLRRANPTGYRRSGPTGRMVPDAPTTMRMRAALAGRLRQLVNRDVSRAGGAAYTVPGQPDWQEERAMFHRGGLPATHFVTAIEVSGRTVSLRLDDRPSPGRVLLALPRFTHESPGKLRRVPASVAVIEIVVPAAAGRSLALSGDHVTTFIAGARDLSITVDLGP